MAKKMLGLVFVSIGLMLGGCKAHVQAKTAETPKPAPAAEPAPAPVVQDDKIVLPGDIEFATNRATIRETEQSTNVLNQLADVMKKNPNITKLRIEGHTDAVGSPAKNLKLSQKRAEAVAAWLVAHEVEKGRLLTVGYGQTRPLVDNTTPEHRAQNRRTEFHIQEVAQKPAADNNKDAVASNVSSKDSKEPAARDSAGK
jgi:outer membrane protein OmpA-like peptidoglycan-associated protein